MAATARPPKVTLAVTLLIVAFAIGIVTLTFGWMRVGVMRMLSNPTAWVTPFAIILWLILIPMAMQGKNWARIGIVVLVLWSAVTLGISTIMLSRYPTIRFTSLFVPWITFLMRIYAGYLLFTPESNAWFRARGPS
ncbi:MAG TPA: hypothetical protein VKU01_06730 [Bryobacteraceae bacterium]|nr:hypothetical protein [Bryobacteraceae bacterium]